MSPIMAQSKHRLNLPTTEARPIAAAAAASGWEKGKERLLCRFLLLPARRNPFGCAAPPAKGGPGASSTDHGGMPRPGPRPYECVRRAWHSDRHQPIRGSLIREIFRVANEIHRPASRKNKEWQEKIPSVVLKAEEIMYSKANSEAEYVDMGTLLDRVNDAIDTIIRRDDTSEGGDGDHLLHPCIEAALTLGCSPRRPSRSERHSNPRCYLSGFSVQESTKMSTSSLDAHSSNRSQLVSVPHFLQPQLPSHSRNFQSCNMTTWEPWYSTMSCSPAMGHLGMGSANLAVSINIKDSLPMSSSTIQFPSDDLPLYGQEKSRMETRDRMNFGRIYPLYYGDILENMEPCSSFKGPLGTSYHDATVGSVPYVSSCREISVQNFLGGDNSCSVAKQNSGLQETCESAVNMHHDLSLQLGLPSTVVWGCKQWFGS